MFEGLDGQGLADRYQIIARATGRPGIRNPQPRKAHIQKLGTETYTADCSKIGVTELRRCNYQSAGVPSGPRRFDLPDQRISGKLGPYSVSAYLPLSDKPKVALPIAREPREKEGTSENPDVADPQSAARARRRN